MKRIFTSILCIILILTGSISAQAEEITSEQDTYSEIFTLNGKTYDVILKGNRSKVTVTRSDEVTVIEYDGDNETLFIDGKDCSNQVTFSVIPTISKAKSVSGTTSPVRYSFDVNPSSVGEIVGAIIAVAVVASAVVTSGLTIAAFSTAIDSYFAASDTGELLSLFFPYASVNGFYQFAQKYNGMKRQNINRNLYIRVGYNIAYKIRSFGNSGWFDTSKP